jgi:4'-phosphopantetheinyl transferase
MPDAVIEVHVASLDVDEDRLAELRSHLDAEERAREAALVIPGAKRRFVCARGLLRELLSERVGGAPANVPLRIGEIGKPALDPAVNPHDLHFNLSHSGELVLVAMAEGLEVGVDVERPRRLRRPEALATRILTPGELEVWHSVPAGRRDEELLGIWTRKEACVKAMGAGLRIPLREVELIAGGSSGEWRVAGEGRGTGRWTVLDLETGEGYVGAVAGDGGGWRLSAAR